MPPLRMFEYAVILQPKEDKDGNLIEQGEVIVNPTSVLAADEKQATLVASRSIPDNKMEELDRLTLVVRPF